MAFNFNPTILNSAVSNENFSITNSGRNTISLKQVNQPVQRKGSMIQDPRTDILYYSDGVMWIPLATGSLPSFCIEDADGDTRVCTDTVPETDSDTIFFRTMSTDRAIFNPSGVLIATAGAVDPTTIIPAAGKVAHFEGDINVAGTICNSTGDLGLDPNSGTGTVNITGNLNVVGTTTSIDTENLLVRDNAVYLNNGYTTTTPLSGCLSVNYLPTGNTATVIATGFTVGVAAVSNPTVVTDNANAWVVGDIIQISGATNVANDGLFEVLSYANPTLTIRGVGLSATSFTFFQDQFTTDTTAGGTITQVNVSAICSGPDGIWEVSSAPSNDNTTGMIFTDLSTGGLTTVGTVGADFTTIEAACTAGETIVRVITDVTETSVLDLSSCPHFRIEINPGITIDNTIAAAADWVIGDDTLLKIVGSGAHMDLTTAGLSSQITLQAGQTFRSGDNAELDVEGIRFTGSGTNVLLGGSSRVSKCRFDGSAGFELDLFERNLIVDGCLFTVPVQLDSLTGAEPKSAIISNNVFDDGADITIAGVDDLVFSGNTIGKTAATPMGISGASCDNVVIANNIFEFSELTISSTTLTNTNISNNVWARDTVDGITISSSCTKMIVSNNVVDHVTMNSTLTECVIEGNAIGDDLTVTGTMTNTKITDNCMADDLILAAMVSSVIGDNVITANITATTNTNSSVTGNHFATMTFSGAVVDGTIDGNEASGDVTFVLAVNDSIISANTIDSFLFSSSLNNTRITGNTMKSTLTITGTSTDVVISSNTSNLNWVITGNNTNSSISDNRIGTNFSVLTFSGIFAGSTLTGTRVGLISFALAVSDSIISSNVVSRFIFSLTVTNTQIVGNNMINPNFPTLTITGASDRVSISSNIGFHSWIFTGDFIDGTISDNRVSLGAGTGFVLFSGTFIDSTMAGNNVEGIVSIVGAVSTSSISSNTVLSFSLGSSAADVSIIGNTMTRTNLATLTITGVSNRVIVSSNVGYHSWVFTGDFNNGTISNNRINGVPGGPGSVLFSGVFDDGICTGNTFGPVTFTGAVTESNISSNTVLSLTFVISAADVTITSNHLSSIAGNSLSIGTTSLRVAITGNSADRTWLFTGNFTDGVVSGNKVGLSVTFGGTFVDSIFGDNGLGTALVITGVSTRSAIKGNTIGTSIAIDGGGSGNSTNNSITGNICSTTIAISALAGIVGNVINGNVSPTSITIVSVGAGNIVTSNRTSSVVGIVAGDLMANNI